MGTTPQPLFVVGSHRGGTSLLYALLNQHPRIRLMYEAQAAAIPGPAFTAYHPGWLRRQEFWNRTLSRHGVALPSGAAPRDAWELYRLHAGTGAIAYAGEKDPTYQTQLPRLLREFPGARVVVIWRDASNVVRSIRRAGRNSRFFAAPGWPQRTVFARERLLADRRRLDPRGERTHFVDYEALVAAPEACLRALCGFLRLPYDPAMATLEGADLSAVDDAPHHNHLHARHIGRAWFRDEPLEPELEEALRRFETRWAALRRGQPAPSLSPAMARLRAEGRLFHAWDRLKRGTFHYCPLALLRGYRAAKRLAGHGAEAPLPASAKAGRETP